MKDSDVEFSSLSSSSSEKYIYTAGEIILILTCSVIILCAFFPGRCSLSRNKEMKHHDSGIASADENETLKTRIELV